MKKLLAICLSVLLICAAMPFAFATASEEPTIEVSKVEAKAGDTVDVQVLLKNNPGIVSAKIKLLYDTEALELVSYYDEDEEDYFNQIVPGDDYSNIKWGSYGPLGTCLFNFCHATSKSKNYTGELFFTATFKVKDGAAAGTYPLTVVHDNEDFYNCANDGAETVAFTAVDGSITVVGDEPAIVIPETPEGAIYFAHFQEGDLTGWQSGCALEVVNENDGKAMKWDASGADWANMYNYTTNIAKNGNYIATLTVKADRNTNMNLKVLKGDWSADTFKATFDVTTEWTTVNVPFSTGEGSFLLLSSNTKAASGATYYLDNITITVAPAVAEPSFDGYITNGDFETGKLNSNTAPGGVTGDWFNLWGSCTVEFVEGMDSNKAISITAGSWAQVRQDGIKVKPNTNYILTGYMKNANNFGLVVKAGDDSADIKSAGPITCDDWQKVTVEFNSGNYESICVLMIAWQDGGSAILDNVSLVEAPACAHEYDGACDPDCNLCGETRDVHTGLVHFDAVDAGCHYNGNIEYWYCPACEGFWADEALTQVTNSKNVIIPAVGGDVTAFAAVEPACHYNGNIAYWVCYECEQVWADEALTQVTNIKNVVLPATGSENLQHVEAVAPTCQSEGNIEYWYCPDCEQFWQDEALTQLTNSKNVKLGVADHSIVHFDAVEAGCHYIGNIEYWFCSACATVWQDEALTQITNIKNVIVPAKGGDVVAYEAIEPACHYNGQIAYWYCPECDQFWADEALTQITNSKNVILPATGSENLQHVEAKDPTCSELGNIEYWYCPDCEQFWQDEALTQLTNSKNVLIATLDHTIVHMDAVEAGCHYNGNIEYWFCSVCATVWQDEALTQITNIKNVIVPAKGGDVVAFEAIEPACHYNGNIAYWVCYECEQVWADEALTQLTNIKNVVLPATGSENLQHVEAKDPTCSELGNVEYWFCPDCEQFWQDEALTQLTNSKNVLIATLDHTIVHMDAVEAGCHYNGNIEYWFCSVCATVWQDEALTQITNIKNVVVPAKGGDVVAFEAIEPSCHYNGQIAYWVCYECEQVWADEALTQLTNIKNVVLPATGSENLKHVEAKDPTATENGNIEYWFCPDCEQYWQDAALTQLTNSKNVIIPATGVKPDSPVTGDSIVPVVVALLTLIVSGVAVSVLNKKRA